MSVSYADVLLLGIPVALWADFIGHNPTIAFVASGIAVLRLAAWMGQATEAVAIHSGPRIGGFLNGTFGNAAELIIIILAIRAGLFEVVKASITGSILGNSLLVLGAAAFAGGLKHKAQVFNRNVARFNVSLMFIALAALVVPAIFHAGAHPMKEPGLQTLSLWTAVTLLVVYAASLYFSFKTHSHLFVAEAGMHEQAKWSKRTALAVLLGATAGVVVMSEILVGSLEPVINQLGWSELFVGIVVVALVGNAAEHATAVTMALQDRMAIAVEIAIGSTTQIALLVAPIAVLASHLFGSGMSLEFQPSELVAILISVLTVNQITRDGETNWLEGFMLLAAYFIIAVAFFFVPAR
ncbi:MAG TPA: calcium/proton exchanger [Symbiobacteriaceae bacterium]|jgi:Ca2+:H+ antiporter